MCWPFFKEVPLILSEVWNETHFHGCTWGLFFSSFQVLHFPSSHTSLKMKVIVSIYGIFSLPLFLTHVFSLFWHRLSHGLQHLGNIHFSIRSSTGYRECSPPLLTFMSPVHSSLSVFLFFLLSLWYFLPFLKRSDCCVTGRQ